MLVPIQTLSIEKQYEVAGRSLNKESQVSLASYYHVSTTRVHQIVQKCKEDPEFKSKALAAASLFYEMNPDKRPKAARAVPGREVCWALAGLIKKFCDKKRKKRKKPIVHLEATIFISFISI